MEKELIFMPFEFKAIDSEDANVLIGYGAAFDNVDSYGDVIKKGAFKKTIKERVNKGRVKLMNSHGYSVDDVLGTILKAEEDDYGLLFSAEFSKVQSSQDVRTKMIEGHVNRLSIGFNTVKEHYGNEKNDENPSLRYLDEVKLYEISPVAFPANENAVVVSIKSMIPFQDLPLADVNYKWDPEKAERRVREWAGDDDPNAKYRKAFMYYDRENPLEFDSYKLQITDIVDGKLTVIPEAVKQAAQALHNERSSVDVPNVHDAKIKSHIEQYCEKMDGWFTPTWKKSGYDLIIDITGIVTPDQKRIIKACKGLIDTDPEHRIDILNALSEKAEPVLPLTQDDEQHDEPVSVEKLHAKLAIAKLQIADNKLKGVE